MHAAFCADVGNTSCPFLGGIFEQPLGEEFLQEKLNARHNAFSIPQHFIISDLDH
jgi:hypothetical protein